MADNLSMQGNVNIDTSAAQSNLKALEAEARRLAEAMNKAAVGSAEYGALQKQQTTNTRNLASAYKILESAAASEGKSTLQTAQAKTEAIKAEIAQTKALADAKEKLAKGASANNNLTPATANTLTAGATGVGNLPLAPANDAAYKAYIKQVVADDAQAQKQILANRVGTYSDQFAAASKSEKQITAETKAQAAVRVNQARAANAQMVTDTYKSRQTELNAIRDSFITEGRDRIAAAQQAAARVAAAYKAANTDANPGVSQKINSAANPNLGLPSDKELNQTSYALFNVAQSVGIVGTALTAAGSAAVVFGVQYESAFTQVERTNPDASAASVDRLHASLLALSETTPFGFQQLSGIAALGSQLGIAESALDSFSKTTAEYSAVTGVTTDAAAQGFGSLFELLNVGTGDFEKLASSVNYVGVKSVATDQEILNLATSIGASTTQAGFLADQTIGLAGALASLRIQPEQARGVILRLFSDFDKTVSKGGAGLEAYAKVLGVTSDQAAKLYKTDASGFFDSLIKGLSASKDLNGTLGQLGISETREVNVLQRLAGNYDVYAQSMENASQAYSDGTFLGQSYGKVADDAATKIAELVNTIQNLLAKAGQSIFPILTPILAIIATIVQGLGALPAPLLGVVTGVTILVGTMALFVAGGLALVATAGLAKSALTQVTTTSGGTVSVMTGLRTILAETSAALGITSAASRVAAINVGSVGTAATKGALGLTGGVVAQRAYAAATASATVTTNGFKTALLGVPIINIVAALSILVPILFSIKDGFDRASAAAAKAGDDLANAGGGIQAYYDALVKDSAGMDKFSKGTTTVKVAVDSQAKSLQDSAAKHAELRDSINDATGATDNASTSTAKATGKLEEQTLAIGKNAKAWVANALAKESTSDSDSPLNKLFNDPKQAQFYQQQGIDIGKAVSDGLGKQGGVVKALQDQIAKAKDPGLISPGDVNALAEMRKNALDAATAADALNSKLSVTSSVNAALGLGVQGTGGDLDAASASASGFADTTQSAAQHVSDLFSAVNDASSFASGMNALRDSIDENGQSFDALTVDGSANLAALGTALQNAVTYGADLGVPAADSMAQSLVSIGLSTDQVIALMNQLKQSNPEIYASLNIDDVVAKYKQLASLGNGAGTALGVASAQANLSRLEAQRTKLAEQLKSQQATASRGSGARKQKADDTAAKNAKKIADSIKTAAEYAQDIGSAMKDAFDKKFGVQQSIDTVTTKFQDLRDRIDEAKRKIADLKITLQKLASDKQILQIQLGVAVDYGDTTRAAAIRADLAQNASDTASTQKDLKSAQDAASVSLAGNTKAAIDNRAAVLDLITAYQGQITAFAQTGASASQVQAYIKTLQGQFEKQLTQLGFNKTAVGNYAGAFDNLRVAVGKVPTKKTVTVTANTSQAISALGGVGTTIGSLSGQLSDLDAQITAAKNRLDKDKRAAGLQSQLITLNGSLAKATKAGADNVAARIIGQIDAINKKLASGNYFRGGTIGGGNKKVSAFADDTVINAKVGEGVVNLKGMAMLGTDGLNALNKQQNPFPPVIVNAGSSRTASSGVVQVELSPIDRQLLANAGNVSLSIDGKTINNVNNATNLANSRRGA